MLVLQSMVFLNSRHVGNRNKTEFALNRIPSMLMHSPSYYRSDCAKRSYLKICAFSIITIIETILLVYFYVHVQLPFLFHAVE